MAYKNNLITGITELLVLKILEQQDSYVYEIQKMINNHSEQLLSISQKRTRVYYHLEETGKEHLAKVMTNYNYMIDGVNRIINSLGGAQNE